MAPLFGYTQSTPDYTFAEYGLIEYWLYARSWIRAGRETGDGMYTNRNLSPHVDPRLEWRRSLRPPEAFVRVEVEV